MPEDAKPGTPPWWLRRLESRLYARRAGLAKLERYYSGDHPLPFLTKTHNSSMRNEFSQLLADSRSNFMRLVVDAVEERLNVEGFRLSASTDEQTDSDTWDIWQANQLDSDSQAAFVDALVKGVSYLSVWAPDHPDGYPVIAVEDASQTIVAYAPGTNFRQRAAAVKVWRDDETGLRRANVYLPDGIYKYQADSDKAGESPTETEYGNAVYPLTGDEAHTAWKPLAGDLAFVANPLNTVPIIPLRNRPRILCEGESEICDLLPIQNSINGLLFLLALAGYFGAHRQRWAVGLTLMEDKNGKPVEPFDVAIDRLWVHEDPDVKFGEFSQTSLQGYIDAIEQKVLHIAVTSRTPRHYLVPDGQSPSGDAMRSAESGLVKKVQRKQRPFGEGLEEAMRLARRFAGKTDSPVDSEVVWSDPRTRTEGEIADAAVKLYLARIIGRREALALLGYTQTAIERLMAEEPLPLPPDPAQQLAAVGA